jgi:hypothetical protein
VNVRVKLFPVIMLISVIALTAAAEFIEAGDAA